MTALDTAVNRAEPLIHQHIQSLHTFQRMVF
jgi:hypothetical protein